MIVKRGNLFSPEAWNKQHLQFSLGTQEKLCTWLHESKRIPAGLLAMAAHSQPPVAWRAHLWPNEKKWNKWYGLDMVMAPQEKPGPVMCLVFWGVSRRMLRRGLWITKLTRLLFCSIAASAHLAGVTVEQRPSYLKVTMKFELEHHLSMTDYVILQTECHLLCHHSWQLVTV
jgi:hypothetical protein